MRHQEETMTERRRENASESIQEILNKKYPDLRKSDISRLYRLAKIALNHGGFRTVIAKDDQITGKVAANPTETWRHIQNELLTRPANRGFTNDTMRRLIVQLYCNLKK